MVSPSNSALVWYPEIVKLGLQVGIPKTVFVLYDHEAAVDASEERSNYKLPWKEVGEASFEVGLPAFVRTDQASAKHHGPHDYKLTTREAKPIRRLLRSIIEDNEMKLWLSPEQPKAFMVRQWIELRAEFCAFANAPGVPDDAPGHPIAAEWRVFSGDGMSICQHPYWPEDAIRFRHKQTGRMRDLYGIQVPEVVEDEPEGWREKLRAMYAIPPPEEVVVAANKTSRALGGRWSVDFAPDVQGKWWLIDMAMMASSWHPESCPYAKQPKETSGDG